MADCSDDLRDELENQYCPPVDSALFAAIVTDFDLGNPHQVRSLRETLDSIKELAMQQENLPFDPSGTANHHLDVADLGANSSARTSSPGQDTLPTNTDSTSQASHLLADENNTKGSNLQNPSRTAYTVAADGSIQLVGGSDEDKVNMLVEMFPDLSSFNIEQSLKKSGGDIDKSMDILLNLSFFDQAQTDEDCVVIPKGLDGFLDGNPDIGRQKGRKKKRNKNHKVAFGPASSSEDAPVTNLWETGKTDVEFICSRTPDLSRHRVASAYTANNRSLSATIKALAVEDAPKDVGEIEDDPVVQSQMIELAGDYPNLPQTTLVGLLRITRNMISAANELAAEMIRHPSAVSVSELVKITVPKLNLDDEAAVVDTRGRAKENVRSTLDYEDEQVVANTYFAARSVANMQAAQAARKAKSDPLYGGASQYYREVAQQQRELAMQHLSAASERLVDRQSSNGDLDLHGCQVPHAIRISRERVDAWWDGLGDTKYVRGGGKHVHGGFKIITGVGLHSRDGTSRLGPAVSKALISDGWRVEIGRGFLTVIGVDRRWK
ncbi:uncharacterized protein N7482_004380 [Penicillium canariense]|uniref:Smr domain-containing protein n=1 Tax=Penicillium canariense TaxID=189055 RepID=A0A9W9I6H8_9EURO|nr:uncharacterized protein N7482_004380 [Penicillium canariense]KAJ5168786.1 hypothetical protein N7482_004380 [Penicillium canariense]